MAAPTKPSDPIIQGPTKTPFKNIALAFSGGGFRAGSFCLGTLSYLQEATWVGDNGLAAPLLQQVSYISSASGGTITSAMYALYQAEGEEFELLYKDLFVKLEGTVLLDKVTKLLNTNADWKHNEHKRRNLINAFALAYDAELFRQKTIGNLAAAKNVASCHLDEVCFNATDFYRGLVFQQAVKMKKDKAADPDFWYGNYILHVSPAMAAQLKLSDVLAASSCFPAGFEPIMFPNDFAYQTLTATAVRQQTRVTPQELKWEELRMLYTDAEINKAIAPPPANVEELQTRLSALPLRDSFEAGLMDGGVDDNQGLDSLMRASERRVQKQTNFPEFDLMLINDVGSYFMDPYKPAPAGKPGGISIYTILVLSGLGALIAVAGFVYLHCNPPARLLPLMLLSGAAVLIFVAGVAVVWLLLTLRQFIAGKLQNGAGLNLDKNFTKDIRRKLFRFFGHTPVGVVFKMIKERVSSILTLNNDVFLKRVRQLLYQQFLADGRRSFRMKTNHVYDLAFSNDIIRRKNDPAIYSPSEPMQIVAQCAFEMPTTLWFDNIHKQDYNQAALIACGQFTTCYNLLVYVKRMDLPGPDGKTFLNSLSQLEREKVEALRAQLEEHYAHFKADPFWLYNKLGASCAIPNFTAATMATYKFPGKEFGELR